MSVGAARRMAFVGENRAARLAKGAVLRARRDSCESPQAMEPGRAPSWQISKGADGVIYSRFVGPTRTDEFTGFLQALLLAMPAANARLVFDLRQLGGYNAETKEPMKAWLLQHKLAISELTVVVPQSGAILKMVSAAIGLATGVKIRVRDELEEHLPFAAQ